MILESGINTFVESYSILTERLKKKLISFLAKNYESLSEKELISGIQSIIGNNYNITKELTKDYLKIVKGIGNQIKQYSKFTAIDIEMINKLKIMNFDAMANVTNLMQTQLINDIVKASMIDIPFEKIVDNVQSLIDSNKHLGETIARTAINTSMQAIRVKKAQDVGIERYQYEGGLQDNSRDFCNEYSGEIVTLEEIQAMHADMFPDGSPHFDDVLIYRGGYNCNHQWIPVIENDNS